MVRGEVVPHCQPFCGTGTAIVAALEHGRNSLEMDANCTNYHELNSRSFAKFAPHLACAEPIRRGLKARPVKAWGEAPGAKP